MTRDIWFGWTEIYVNSAGLPSDEVTPWRASAFVLFTHIIYIGKVKPS